MTEYRLNCDADSTDYLTVDGDGNELEFYAHRDGMFRVSVYPTVNAARTFARGILALADEIDGGEAKAEPTPVKVGDRVRIVRATYADETHGREGVVASTSETWRATNGDPHPYVVRLNDGDTVHVAELERIDEPADEPTTPTNPRADYVTQAQAMLADDYNHTVADVLALARFLAGE